MAKKNTASASPLRRSPRKHKRQTVKAVKDAEPALPPIKWGADGGKLIWLLIRQLEDKQNRLVLFGKQSKDENTSGESKISVYQRIGSVVLPELYKKSPHALAKRMKGKAEDLVSTYKEHAKELQGTGGGLRNGDDDAGVHQYLECYISPEGPDHDTTDKARNLWGKITQKFPYFPDLHKFLGARSNIIPPVLTTGIGPEGRKVVHLQPPIGTEAHGTEFFDEANIDPSLLSRPSTPERGSPTPERRSPTATPVSSQIQIESSPLVPPPKSSRGKTAVKTSTFHSIVEKAKANFRPPKKSFEDNLVDIQT
ncbi:hypothetical protein DFH09DRAFT_350241 [Mycena vulgaris]|nr:hypothetical protein DFH09DRAFT_350241 [Mycena vulgaris]